MKADHFTRKGVTKRRVLKALKEEDPQSTEELAERLGLSRVTILKWLRILRAERKVVEEEGMNITDFTTLWWHV